MKETVRDSVVGDENIGPTVIIEIGDNDSQALAVTFENAAIRRDVLKQAVSQIQEQPILLAVKALRIASPDFPFGSTAYPKRVLDIVDEVDIEIALS